MVRGRVTSACGFVLNNYKALLSPEQMGGDHRCPVCQATFTRPQHVARHMRSRESPTPPHPAANPLQTPATAPTSVCTAVISLPEGTLSSACKCAADPHISQRSTFPPLQQVPRKRKTSRQRRGPSQGLRLCLAGNHLETSLRSMRPVQSSV